MLSEQAAVRVDDHDVPQPVQGALFAAGERGAAVERSGADGARTEAPDADGGLAHGPGRASVEQLRAVVVGAGPGGGVFERVRLDCRDRPWDWPRFPRCRRRSPRSRRRPGRR